MKWKKQDKLVYFHILPFKMAFLLLTHEFISLSYHKFKCVSEKDLASSNIFLNSWYVLELTLRIHSLGFFFFLPLWFGEFGDYVWMTFNWGDMFACLSILSKKKKQTDKYSYHFLQNNSVVKLFLYPRVSAYSD